MRYVFDTYCNSIHPHTADIFKLMSSLSDTASLTLQCCDHAASLDAAIFIALVALAIKTVTHRHFAPTDLHVSHFKGLLNVIGRS